MSQSAETQDEPARTPGPIATALQPLRLPLALAALTFLALQFLVSLFRMAFGEKLSALSDASPLSARIVSEQNAYLSVLTLILLVSVVALAATREPLKVARPLVLTTLVLTGIGLLLGFIGTLAFLFVESQGPFNSGRDKVEETILDLPLIGLYVLFGLFLLSLLGAKGLPRTPKPERPQQYGQHYAVGPQQGGIPGFPPVEQQQYGYQQQPQPPQQQNPAYDPWQGYPQQGYQQQPQAPYQPEQPYQQPQAPYQPPQQPEPAPYQPPQQAPYQPSQHPDLSKHSEPSAPAEQDRPDSPPAWPSQPTQALPLPEQGQARPEANPQQPGQVQDWYSDQRRPDDETPPPYGNWNGPHL